jgi:hypothetical protein
MRRQLMAPIADDVWYAGEAAHETLWGTVGGAWESGERAADAVLARLGPLKAAPAESDAAPKRKPQRARAEGKEPGSAPHQYFGDTPSIMREER